MDKTLIHQGLELRRQELDARARRVASDLRRESTPVSGGFADQAAERANDPVLQGIQMSAEVEVRLIDNALRRLAEGSYGRCERCDAPISVERLNTVPYATTCADCAA